MQRAGVTYAVKRLEDLEETITLGAELSPMAAPFPGMCVLRGSASG